MRKERSVGGRKGEGGVGEKWRERKRGGGEREREREQGKTLKKVINTSSTVRKITSIKYSGLPALVPGKEALHHGGSIHTQRSTAIHLQRLSLPLPFTYSIIKPLVSK